MWWATLHTVPFPCSEPGRSGQTGGPMATELLFLRDAYLRTFHAAVLEVDDDRVALDRTAFYATGGGQPHDTGVLTWDGGEAPVVEVRKEGDHVWHRLEGEPPWRGTSVQGAVDWDRRHAL